MPCNCTQPKWVVTRPDGGQNFYRTEPEAAAAARRTGGTYSRLS